MKKGILLVILTGCLSLCGCENQQEKIVNETERSSEYSETNVMSEEYILSEDDVQNENSESEYKIVDVNYSDLFHDLYGCAVIYDFDTNEYWVYNEENVNERYSPYSTFKIVSALIGLHNGVLEDENSKMNYDGTIYPTDTWNSNLSLDEAYKTSCVWYFRKVTDAVGMNEVQKELDSLQYGNCDVSEWNGSYVNSMDELNGFWLGSSLKISSMEQVQVMKKIFGGDSIYDENEISILQDIMLYDEVNGYSVYGKTGTFRNEEGWYVGVAEKERSKLCFAVYITSDEPICVATGNEAREIVKNILYSKQ